MIFELKRSIDLRLLLMSGAIFISDDLVMLYLNIEYILFAAGKINKCKMWRKSTLHFQDLMDIVASRVHEDEYYKGN